MAQRVQPRDFFIIAFHFFGLRVKEGVAAVVFVIFSFISEDCMLPLGCGNVHHFLPCLRKIHMTIGL